MKLNSVHMLGNGLVEEQATDTTKHKTGILYK